MALGDSILKFFQTNKTAKNIANFFLPKQAERVLGLTPPETATEKVKKLKPTPQEVTDAKETVLSDPETLKAELKALVLRDIKAGVLNKTTIKNDVNTYLKQKINEQVLSKITPQRNTLWQNAKQDTRDIVDGLGALVGLSIKAVLNPINTLDSAWDASNKLITSPQYREEWYNTWIKPVADEYAEYRHPLTKAYEDPIDVLLDTTILFSLVGKSLGTAGKLALKGAVKSTDVAVAVREAQTALKVAKTAEETRAATEALALARRAAAGVVPDTTAFRVGEKLTTVGEKIAYPLSFKGVSNVTKSVIKALPGGEDLVKYMETASQTRKIV